jgi:acyl-CoA thioesterase FadM
MSGIIRNLMTLIFALLNSNRPDAQSKVDCYFRITPFDCGINVLKSDKYFQLAEAAQLDFLVKTKLFKKLHAEGISFVNASQMVKFMKPISVFKRVRVETRIAFADDKFSYFSHRIFVGDNKFGEVLVKMKFKKSSITISPFDVIGKFEPKEEPYLQPWNQALEAIS